MRLPIFLFLSFFASIFVCAAAAQTTDKPDEEDDTIKGTAKLKQSAVPSKKDK